MEGHRLPAQARSQAPPTKAKPNTIKDSTAITAPRWTRGRRHQGVDVAGDEGFVMVSLEGSEATNQTPLAAVVLASHGQAEYDWRQ